MMKNTNVLYKCIRISWNGQFLLLTFLPSAKCSWALLQQHRSEPCWNFHLGPLSPWRHIEKLWHPPADSVTRSHGGKPQQGSVQSEPHVARAKLPRSKSNAIPNQSWKWSQIIILVFECAAHGQTTLHQAGTSIVQLCAMELALRSDSEWFHVFHLSPRCGIRWSVLSGVPMMGTWSDMKNSESSWITWRSPGLLDHVT